MLNEANIHCRLVEVASVASGYPLRGSVETLEPGDVHFVQIKNTSPDADIEWSQVPRVTLPSKRDPAWLTEGDVVFASRGTRTLAYPLVAVPSKAVCAPQFFVLGVKDTKGVLPEFLAWQINQKPAQGYFQRTATGSYIQNIRREVVENLPIAIPPIQQQQLIVNFWRTAQRERVTLNRLIENRNNQLEAIALGLQQTSDGTEA